MLHEAPVYSYHEKFFINQGIVNRKEKLIYPWFNKTLPS